MIALLRLANFFSHRTLIIFKTRRQRSTIYSARLSFEGLSPNILRGGVLFSAVLGHSVVCVLVQRVDDKRQTADWQYSIVHQQICYRRFSLAEITLRVELTATNAPRLRTLSITQDGGEGKGKEGRREEGRGPCLETVCAI